MNSLAGTFAPRLLLIGLSCLLGLGGQVFAGQGFARQGNGRGVTPILPLTAVLGAKLETAQGGDAGRLQDLIVHRGTGLVTRAVVSVSCGGAPELLKVVPYTDLNWNAARGILVLREGATEIGERANFDPRKIARESARWARREKGLGDTQKVVLPHLLARPQIGRRLVRGMSQIGVVGTLYVAPVEGRVVAWSVRPGAEDLGNKWIGEELLLPWPVVVESGASESGSAQLTLGRALDSAGPEGRISLADRQNLGHERPRLRALFRAFGEQPPNVLLALENRTLVTRR